MPQDASLWIPPYYPTTQIVAGKISVSCLPLLPYRRRLPNGRHPQANTRQPRRQADHPPNPAPSYRLARPIRSSASRPARPVRPHAPARQTFRLRADCQTRLPRNREEVGAHFDSLPAGALHPPCDGRHPLPLAVRPGPATERRGDRATLRGEVPEQGVPPPRPVRLRRMITPT